MTSTQTKIIKNYLTGSFLCFLIGFHAVTVIHECAGHGLSVILLGGKIEDIYISWMGGSGYLHGDLGEAVLTPWKLALFEWAGIVMTLVFGAAVWFVWSRYFRDTIWSGMLLWITVLSAVTGSFGYIVFGLHYGYGDMVNTARFLRERSLLTLAVFGAMAFHGAIMTGISRQVPYLQHKWLRFESWKLHMVAACLVMGAGAGTVGLLNVAEGALLRPDVHSAIMRTEAMRKAEQQAETRNRQLVQEGKEPMTEEETETFVRKQADQYTPWPVYLVYIPFLFVCIVLGMRKGTETVPELQRPSRIPAWLWLADAGSIAASPFISRL